MKRYYERYWQDKDVLSDFSYKWPKIKKFIPSGKIKLLDFGCGTGVLLKEVNKLNSEAKITGVDVSERALKIVRKRFPKYKFRLIQDGGKLPFKSNTFDFVLAADVIEHVYDTENTFSEIARVLKKGGKLLVSVPYHGLIKNLIIALFFWEKIFTPYTPHIRFFTKKSLTQALEEHGFEVIKLGYHGKFYPLSSGMHMLVKKK